MAKTQSTGRTGARRPPPRRGSQSRFARNRGRLGAAAAAIAVVAVLVVVSLSGDGDGGGGADDAASSRPSTTGIVGGDFHSLAADPTTPGRLFVGGHEAVSESRDAGRTWSRIGSLDGADAMGWGFVGDAVYVSGHPGISRATDGARFGRANEGLPDTDIHAFGGEASTLYGAGPRSGVIASTDGGRTWSSRTTARGQAFFGRILIGPNDDQHLIAADVRTGVVESTDGGRNWHELGGPPSAAWVSRGGPVLYASGPRGAGRSTDGGQTWESVTLPQGATLLEADPFEPATLYTGVHDGSAVEVLVSHDSGAQWKRP